MRKSGFIGNTSKLFSAHSGLDWDTERLARVRVLTLEASFREGPVESVSGGVPLMPLDQRGLEKLRDSESVTLQ